MGRHLCRWLLPDSVRQLHQKQQFCRSDILGQKYSLFDRGVAAPGLSRSTASVCKRVCQYEVHREFLERYEAPNYCTVGILNWFVSRICGWLGARVVGVLDLINAD